MTIYVGVLFFRNQCQTYDPATKKYTNINMIVGLNQKNYFNSLMRQIITQIQGDLGGICFCLPYDYGENTKKDIIFNATNFGFPKVKIICDPLVICWKALEDASYIPKNGDKICIIEQHVVYLWQQIGDKHYCSQEFVIHKKITETTVVEIVKRIGSPNIFVYNFYKEVMGPLEVVFRKMLPDTLLFFGSYDYRRETFMKYILREAMSNSDMTQIHEIVKTNKMINGETTVPDVCEQKTDDCLSDYDVITTNEFNI